MLSLVKFRLSVDMRMPRLWQCDNRKTIKLFKYNQSSLRSFEYSIYFRLLFIFGFFGLQKFHSADDNCRKSIGKDASSQRENARRCWFLGWNYSEQ